MYIAGLYSFNNSEEVIAQKHRPELDEILQIMDVIDCGVEIVPVKGLADEMSTGVSYFEQFVWDLEHRGISDIDIPVLIIGIDTDGIKPKDLKIAETRQSYPF